MANSVNFFEVGDSTELAQLPVEDQRLLYDDFREEALGSLDDFPPGRELDDIVSEVNRYGAMIAEREVVAALSDRLGPDATPEERADEYERAVQVVNEGIEEAPDLDLLARARLNAVNRGLNEEAAARVLEIPEGLMDDYRATRGGEEPSEALLSFVGERESALLESPEAREEVAGRREAELADLQFERAQETIRDDDRSQMEILERLRERTRPRPSDEGILGGVEDRIFQRVEDTSNPLIGALDRLASIRESEPQSFQNVSLGEGVSIETRPNPADPDRVDIRFPDGSQETVDQVTPEWLASQAERFPDESALTASLRRGAARTINSAINAVRRRIRPEGMTRDEETGLLFDPFGQIRSSLGEEGITGPQVLARDLPERGDILQRFEEAAIAGQSQRETVRAFDDDYFNFSRAAQEGVGQAAVTIPTAILGGPAAAFALNSAAEGENALIAAIQDGASPADALTFSGRVGVTSGALETVGDVVGARLFGDMAESVLGQISRKALRSTRKAGREISKRIAIGGGTEGLTEAAQGVAERAFANQVYDANKEVFDAREMSREGSVGLLVGAIIGGSGGVTNSILGRRASQAQLETALEQINSTLESGEFDGQKLNKRQIRGLEKARDDIQRLVDGESTPTPEGEAEPTSTERFFEGVRALGRERNWNEEETDATIDVARRLVQSVAESNRTTSDEVFEKIELESQFEPEVESAPATEDVDRAAVQDEFAQPTEEGGIEFEADPATQAMQDIEAQMAENDRALATLNEAIRQNPTDSESKIARQTLQTEQRRLLRERQELQGRPQPADTVARREAAERRVRSLRREQEQAVADRDAATSDALRERHQRRVDSLREQIFDASREVRRLRRDVRGTAEKLADQSRVLITAFQNADQATVLHELTHALDFLPATNGRNLRGYSMLDAALGKHRKRFWNWATDQGKNDRGSEAAMEKIAYGMEEYLKLGRSPTADLMPAFQKVAEMMKRIWASLKNRVAPEMTKAAIEGYDRLFSLRSDPKPMPEGASRLLSPNSPEVANTSPRGPPLTTEPLVPPENPVAEGEQIEGGLPSTGILYQDRDADPGNQEAANPPDFDGTISDPIVQETGEGVSATDARTLIAGQGVRFDRKQTQMKKWMRDGPENSTAKAVFSALGLQPKLRTLLRILSPYGLTERGLQNLKAQSEGLQNQIRGKMERIQRRFERAIKDEFGGLFSQVTNPQVKNDIREAARLTNDYLVARAGADKQRALELVPPGMRSAALEMRSLIDALSVELIQRGAINGDLAAVVEGNLGTYLHRSYKVFDDKAWADRVGEDVKKRALAFFRREGMTDTEAKNAVERYLNPANFGKDVNVFFSKSGLSRKELSLLRRRKDIPEVLRELMGEYGSAQENFAKTIFKMSNLLATHKFLAGVRDVGIREGVVRHPESPEVAGIAHRISAANNPNLQPLAGYLTTREIQQALTDVTSDIAGVDHIVTNLFMRSMLTLNSWFKMGKTVFSPVGQLVNFVGSGLKYFGNGHGLRNLAQLSRDYAAMSAEQREEFALKMLRYGISDQNITAQELKDNLRDMTESDNLLKYSENLAARYFGRGAQAAQRAYQMGDTLWKVAHWYGERADLANAVGSSVTQGEIDQMAADRTRLLMPTYAELPPAIKSFRRIPMLGAFVSFPYSVLKNAAWGVRIARSDIQSNIPELRELGYRRAIALGTVGSMFSFGGSLALRMMQQISREEDEADREFEPPWEEYGHRFYWGQDNDGNFIYTPATSIDPNGWMIEATTALIGGQDEGLWDRLTSAFGIAFDPILSPELGFAALQEALNSEMEADESARTRLDEFWEAAKPGILTSIDNISHPDKTFLGSRLRVSNVREQLGFASRRIKDNMNLGNQIFTRVAGDRRITPSPQALNEAYVRTEQVRQREWQDAVRKKRAALIRQIPTDEVEKIMRERGGITQRDWESIDKEAYEPYQLTEEQARNIVEAGGRGRLELVLDSIEGLEIRSRGGRRVSVGDIARSARRRR